MATNWATVQAGMITAVEAVIGAAWPNVSSGAIAGVKALSAIAQEIESSKDLDNDMKQELLSEYKQSLKIH